MARVEFIPLFILVDFNSHRRVELGNLIARNEIFSTVIDSIREIYRKELLDHGKTKKQT